MIAIDRSRSSPNFGPRAAAFPLPTMIVLHYTGMRDGLSAVDWLCDPASQVSCHYVVAEDGRILQLVADEYRAWHAGRSSWAGVTDINSASIGIEIVNGGHDYGLPIYPEAQIDSLVALSRVLIARFAIDPRRVLAHSDVAPGRKRDPGEAFPWIALGNAGVAHFIPPAPARDGRTIAIGTAGEDVHRLQQALADYGYGIGLTGVFDAETETVVTAFQRRFRPTCVDGRADPQTRDTLDRLHHSHPAS